MTEANSPCRGRAHRGPSGCIPAKEGGTQLLTHAKTFKFHPTECRLLLDEALALAQSERILGTCNNETSSNGAWN